MRFSIDQTITLLRNDFYTDIIEQPTFKILKSIFKENSYNYIIPSVEYSRLEGFSVNSYLKSFKEEGFQFSYYINSELLNSYKEFADLNLEFLYSDLYIYKEINKKFENLKYRTIHLNSSNLDLFIDSAELCFPGWSNNKTFTKWCLDCKYNKMLGIENNSQIISFGAYFEKPNSNTVLLMNDGTLSNFRRQGLHHEIIQARINNVLEKKGNALFFANVENGGASHISYSKLKFSDGPLYYVYGIK